MLLTYAPVSFFIRIRLPTSPDVNVYPSIVKVPTTVDVIVAPIPLVPLL